MCVICTPNSFRTLFFLFFFFIYYTPINIFRSHLTIDNVQFWAYQTKCNIQPFRNWMHRTQNSWLLSQFYSNRTISIQYTHRHRSDVVNFLSSDYWFARTWLQLLIPMLLFDYDLYVYGFMLHSESRHSIHFIGVDVFIFFSSFVYFDFVFFFGKLFFSLFSLSQFLFLVSNSLFCSVMTC